MRVPRPALALLVGAVLTTGGCGSSPELAGSNLVLISVDTLRADHLSLYGYERPTSPFLEELAEEAVVFDSFFSNGGFTLPSHATMMTSLKPTVHGVQKDGTNRLAEERTTLAELLRGRGYSTAAFVDSYYMRRKHGFAQGFDLYDDRGGGFEKILPRTREWLRRNHREPFFLFLHTYDVHSQSERLPYDCPEPYRDRYTDGFEVEFDGCRGGRCASSLFAHVVEESVARQVRLTEFLAPEEIEYSVALYDGCINYVDAKIRKIVGRLESLGVLDRTLLVVTSDHGEEFLDHGRLLHTQRGFEEMAHIPLILRLPGGRHGGLRVRHLAAMVDLMPTVLDVLGVPPAPVAQGRSLMPAIVDGRPVRRETTIWQALRDQEWKLLPERKVLFHLPTDPRERRNRWEQDPEIVRRLTTRQQRLMERDRELAESLRAGREPVGPVELTEEEARELRALGYVD